MAENKTKQSIEKVSDFISKLENEQKRTDSLRLMELMENISGEKARMWGSNIIGFGEYHYKYKSGHEGNAPLLGFSPRKAAISLYVFTGLEEHEQLLDELGKFKMGKACIYAKKLDDLNENALIQLMEQKILFLKKTYPQDN